MIRFYNGRVLSFSRGLDISDSELWTDGPVISYIGPKCEDAPAFERQIDLQGDLIIPGFKNAHTHTPMVFLRSMADDLPLKRWLEELCWPKEAQLTDEACYALTKLGVMEYLSSGITSVFEMYGHTSSVAQAFMDCGFRSVFCSGMNDFDRDPTQIERDYLKLNSSGDLVSYMLGIHGEYTTSPDRLEYMVSLIKKYKTPAFTHLCETKGEVEGCVSRYGMTPPRFLDSIGFYEYGGGGYHCVWMSDEDIKLLADRQLYAVTNPASNLKLASGIAPVTKLMRAGVKVAIGTDGAASNNALDFFREMYLTCVLQHIYENDAAACPPHQVLKMACVNGAEAMGLDSCNDLAPGKKADLVIINLLRPNMQPINDIASNIVLSGSKENVRLTMVNGKVLYENGEFHIGADPDELYAEANAIVKSIK